MDKRLAFCVIFLCAWQINALKVSFYGASHITMPLQEAKMSTNIRLKFRTLQEDAFIFLAAGRTDYCILKLESGRINFIYKIDQNIIELWSPKTNKLNDLLWHDVAIQRYETNVTLQVDEHIIRQTLSTNVTELNIHFGTFLGGVGDFSENYLGIENENFRGCISDVYYNNINILKRAKEKTGHATSVDVSWICSNEFDADINESISFIEDDGFMMINQLPIVAGESWSFELRTIEMSGVIFYNGGNDLILLEIIDEKLRLLIYKGSDVIDIISDQNISDGIWHFILLRYSSGAVELIVDEIIKTETFINDNPKNIELSSHYYFGGINDFSRKKALIKGVRPVELNLKGCIRNIIGNNKSIGYPNMKITKGLLVGCLWQYQCLERQPCILSSVCRQYGLDEFICYCDQAYCLKADYAESYKIFAQADDIEIELLKISPMQLVEGESIFLSSAFIELLLDFSKFGITDSLIQFHIVQPPKYGNFGLLSGNDNSDNSNKYFSLIDLNTDKIKYIHNGGEYFNDHITIDLQISGGNNKNIPDFLLGKHRFVLHANITPVNDAPILEIPINKIFRVTQGIPKILGEDILNAIDPDSLTNSLIYTILPSTNPEEYYGHIEINGKSVIKFSQLEINQGIVTYQINVPTTDDISFEIPIQVSDGIETSQTVYLPVSVHPLQLRIVNNTGLIMVHKSSALITPWNLSVISNSDEDSIDVRYDIIQPPHYGSVQKLRSIDSSWITVDSFTSSQVVLGQIRYYHSLDFPLQDEFKFSASFGPIKTQKYDFRITFTKLKIGIAKSISLPINGSREATINAEILFHQTTPLPTFSRNIIYTVLQPTKYGGIYVEGHPKLAKEMDSFTQLDIDKNLIHYKTYRTSYSSFIDYFEFMVSVSECDDYYGHLKIIYNPEEHLTSRLSYQTKENLRVQEGDRALITKKNFEILFNTFDNLTFVVSEEPRHGSLCTINTSNGQITTINEFPLEKLYLGDIYYCHDDTETTIDSLRLLVLSDDEINLQYICSIDIDIVLINDNGPYRGFDKIFHIVREETRTVKSTDLLYIDQDINSNLSEIFYTHIVCLNGEFYKSGRYADRFTQDDINNRRIVFQHTGPDIGTASFIVTDGLYEIPGTLEIHASDPFVEIPQRNATIVQEGKFVVLKANDLSIETNLDMKLDEILYKIIKSPVNGILKMLKRKLNTTSHSRITNQQSISNFTQLDVERERLVYWNTETASMDKIKYQVSIKNISAEGEILIRIYPAAYWEPLHVLKNQTLYVEESTSVLISKDILEIIHPSISPGDITYLVTSSPLHGYLEIQSITSDDEYNCKVFDQSTINSEKMFYIQAGVNQSSDYFIFDVTNGITWLRDLRLNIVIIPENLYIKTNIVNVVEGKTISLQSSDMFPYSEYYKTKLLEYKIIQQPAFGYITSGKSKVNRFTQKQLETGVVQYIHNGNENSTDLIKLIGIARNKESIPFDLNINVIPVNDEIPIIITNTGLQLWNGGTYVVKNTDIMAQDYDTPPDNLTYHLNHIYGGYLAHASNLNIKLDDFTQGQIDREEIIFIHDADTKRNEFSFIVTDGLFNTTEQTIYIKANPVDLIEINNKKLHVFPMTRKQILSEQLDYKCSDELREIKYNITSPPHLGRILYEFIDNGYTKEITEFEQKDIDNGRILYEHITPMLELKTIDSFIFDIVAYKTNTLYDQKFEIEISVSSGGLLRFLPVSKLHLDEGESTSIKLDFSKILEYLKSRAGMTSPELYIEVYKPQHGTIELINGKKGTKILYPNDFATQKVFYLHDHSDSIEDKIFMAVHLTQGSIFLCNLTIPVSINPINDQQFNLVTQSPHMTIVEGENKTITNLELLTKDADTEPKDIIYEIISGPTLGLLMKINDNGYSQDLLVYANQFSQDDINTNRIIYVHYGSPQSTTFYFKVSDGAFKPAYEIFNITILPIFIESQFEQEPIKIQQGSKTVFLEPKHIAINTNVKHYRLMYNITNSPLSGFILLNTQPTLQFSQNQLETNKISYMPTDINKSNDTFQVNAYIIGSNYGALVNVTVIVEPFIQINTISIISGGKTRLFADLIYDNPTLAKLNRYNPKIHITYPPRNGSIRKIIRNSGETESTSNYRDINVFTYKELKSGVIYFVAEELPNNIISITDHFDYIVIIKTIQPAQSTVNIEIHTYNENNFNNYNPTVNVTQESVMPLNYIVLAGVLICLILLILATILIVRLRYNNSLSKCKTKKELPPTLPRPPNFVTLNNNRLYSSSDGDSIPVTAASTPLPGLSNIPHCKVTPMIGLEQEDFSQDDIDERQMQRGHLNPYGENDDWSSSCDDITNEMDYSTVSGQHQQTTNPLLRRNQYWV